ncbi:MAG: hypothetical protein WBW84_01345 [Acidobacteriaceae bacterium]
MPKDRINKVTGPENRRRRSRIVAFLVILFLGVILLLLGHAMVRHRFHRGGWMNQRHKLQP